MMMALATYYYGTKIHLKIKDHLGNVRTVISDIKNPYPLNGTPSGSIANWTYLADVRNISNMYPYGKSYPAAATYSADDDYRYGFNGMEKEKSCDSKGDVADFGARFLDSEYPIFGSPDPHEREYPGISTYSTFASNPILHIDPTGKNYSVSIDHNKDSEGNGTIIIKATFYTVQGDVDSKKSLNLGIEKWEGMNGKFTYEVETQNGVATYNIEFDFDNVEIDPNLYGKGDPLKTQTRIDDSPYKSDNKKVSDNSSNLYEVRADDDPIFDLSKNPDDNAGMAMSGRWIYVKSSYDENITVSGHEIGHILGISHIWRTIMQSDLEKENPVITNSVIKAVLIHANIKKLNTIISNTEEGVDKPIIDTKSGQKEPKNFDKGEVKEKL